MIGMVSQRDPSDRLAGNLKERRQQIPFGLRRVGQVILDQPAHQSRVIRQTIYLHHRIRTDSVIVELAWNALAVESASVQVHPQRPVLITDQDLVVVNAVLEEH